MSTSVVPRSSRVRAWIAPLAAAAGVVAALLAWHHGLFLDLRIYRLGAGALGSGDLYVVRHPQDDLPFTYPPFAAVVMVPLAAVPIWLGAMMWVAGCVAALGWVVDRTLRACGRETSGPVVALVVVAALLCEPVWETLAYGQVNLFLMALVVADLLGRERRWSGALVGVAAGIKLTPLFLVALLIVVGRRRGAANALLAFVGTAVVGAAVAPRTSWDYWTEALWDTDRIGAAAYAGNQSIMALLTRVLGHEPSSLSWLVAASVAALLSLTAAALLWRSPSPAARPAAVCVAALGMLLASPVSWSHHWVWLVPLVIALWHSGVRCAQGVAVVVAATAWSWAIWWPPSADDREYAWAGWQLVAGNAYVVVALGAAVVLAVSCASTSSPQRVMGES